MRMMFVVSACILVLPGGQLLAQGGFDDDKGCGQPHWDCSTGLHKNLGPAPNGLMGLHGGCDWCGPTGDPADCHDECVVSPEPALQLAYETLLRAAREGDIASMLRLAPLTAAHVHYNAERGSLQVMGCDGADVIANFAITPAQGAELSLARLAGLHGNAARQALAYLSVRSGYPVVLRPISHLRLATPWPSLSRGP